jgi:DNA-binding GntR family transcriptional regulator
VRNALEVGIIREAAEQGLPASALREAERAIAEQREAGDDPNIFTDADDRFHRTFANAIGYGDIWSIVESQKAQFDRIRFLSLPEVTPVDLLIRQHRALSRRGTPQRPRKSCARTYQSWSRQRRH